MKQSAVVQAAGADLKVAERRVRRVAVEVLEGYLPALIGALAEKGLGAEEQARCVERLVAAFEGGRIAETLEEQGRPVLALLHKERAGIRVNASLLSTLADDALTEAFAPILADALGLSPTLVSLIVRLRDDKEVRALAGQAARHASAPPVSPTRIPGLVSWRLDRFEARHAALISALGAELEPPEQVLREPLRRALASEVRWPEWFDVSEVPYLVDAVDRAATALRSTPWAGHASALTEVIWDCGGVSPQSALRQAAHTLRNINGVNHRGALPVIACGLAEGHAPLVGRLGAWPDFAELARAWEELRRQEACVLGSWRGATELSEEFGVYDAPGVSIGLSEPVNLPWSMPLLCWSTRERDALRDLLRGMARALESNASAVRAGRLRAPAWDSAAPLGNGERVRWRVGLPRRVPAPPVDFEHALDRAFASARASMNARFERLNDDERQRAIALAQGAYSGYLTRTRSVWRRRLSPVRGMKSSQAFDALISELARALGLPLLIDVFDSPAPNASLAAMPAFCAITAWNDEGDFAPLWLPADVMGESFGNAPIRARVVHWAEGRARWMGDHVLQGQELRQLPGDRLMGSLYEGTLMMTLHRRDAT
ncbi:hypothetical protein [Lujinxingia litoralis]|uniref:hypothetical protein n=1 Tax=Lujinxingia litoralis TaxID=2211119 RepID=UPI001313FDAB|nr:hypothetical protein [Lujinxingia litoralis]